MFFKPFTADKAKILSEAGRQRKIMDDKKSWERLEKEAIRGTLKMIKARCKKGSTTIHGYNTSLRLSMSIGSSHPIFKEVNKYLASLGYNVTSRDGMYCYYDISWAD